MYNNYYQAKTPQQIQQEYNALMQQYQNLYTQNNVPIQQTNTTLPKGTYTYVNSYDDVINAPVSADGSASIFFDMNNGIFWSKKFTNGQSYINSFSFQPLNKINEDDKLQANDEKTIVSTEKQANIEDMLKSIVERLDKLEGKEVKSNE